MKRLLFLIVVIGFTANAYSQIAISYYPFQSILSVSSNTEKFVWADLRVQTNTFFSNINLEFAGLVNIKRTNWVNYYSGIGISLNPFSGLEDLPLINGYALYAGVRIKPIQKYKHIQVIFELSPYVNKYFDGGLFRTLLGISYNL